MGIVFEILALIVWLYIILMFIRLAMNWVQVFAPGWTPRGAVAVGAEVVFSATDPPLRAVGRVVPPLRIGSVSLDLAFIIVMFVLFILHSLLKMLAS